MSFGWSHNKAIITCVLHRRMKTASSLLEDTCPHATLFPPPQKKLETGYDHKIDYNSQYLHSCFLSKISWKLF